MSINIAIVGATGLVGQEILKILDQRQIKLHSLKLLASKASVGKKISFRGEEHYVKEARPESFRDVDIAIFSAGTEVSKVLAPEAVTQGAIVIDNSNAFRMDVDVPLVVPEVNSHSIKTHQGIIANPNCSTIQMVVALKPIYDYSRITKIWVSTYQSVSGAGLKAMDNLLKQTNSILQGKKLADSPNTIAFNLLPQIDQFLENGYTREEMKMVNETRKILNDCEIQIEPTTVRVPVLIGHSESITIETTDTITPEIAKILLTNAPGVTVMDNIKEAIYPTPREIASKDNVYVGRVRQSLGSQKCLSMWVVGDNIRKGAALNAIQILELLL